ncbi:MAG: GDP-mannose 4,6-dehydratase [Candidatus Omnitrophota bacterium]|jgi:CDP-glucose 4,6-dehydratase
MEDLEGLNMSNAFWKNKSVLVTGYEGFLGSHLVNKLVGHGAWVSGLDIKTRRKETVLSADVLKRVKIIKGSVENYRLLLKILKQGKIEYVFHLAATSIVGEALSGPLKAFSTNIQGTWNVLEACRNVQSIRGVIIASSDKAYGTQNKLPYMEDGPLCGIHPYDVSKSCADLLSRTYFHTYNLPVVITRCGNIYGPGDFNFSRLIPDALRCLFLNKTLKIRSDGKFIRDYVYIDDIVSGYTRIAELLNKGNLSGQVFNLSDEKPMTVVRLLNKLNKLKLGRSKLRFRIMNSAKYEIKEQYLCSKKARRAMGWRPQYCIEDGLKKTADWYADYFRK